MYKSDQLEVWTIAGAENYGQCVNFTANSLSVLYNICVAVEQNLGPPVRVADRHTALLYRFPISQGMRSTRGSYADSAVFNKWS